MQSSTPSTMTPIPTVPLVTQPVTHVPDGTVTPDATISPGVTPGVEDWVLASPVAEERYQVNLWTAEKADVLIRDVFQRIDQVEDTEQGQTPDIQQALRVILQDALWRFPEANQATEWRWLYAALLVRNQERAAADLYASLISNALQAGKVTPEDLLVWLQDKVPQGSFSQQVQSPLHEQEYRALLEFRSGGAPAYFWLTKQAGEYQISLLTSSQEFRTNAAVQIELEWDDLTGDGIPEAWIITIDRSRRYEMAALAVYDVSSATARRLEFQPALPVLQVGSWQLLEEDGQITGLQAGLRLDGGDALCEYLLPVIYRPDGLSYRWVSIGQPDLDELVASGLSDAQARLCLDLGVDLLRGYSSRGDRLARETLGSLLDGFPYGMDSALYLGLYPPDEGDRARFELGLYAALDGDMDSTRAWMARVIAHPDYESSPWPDRAQAFLDGFGETGDLRHACLASQSCYGTSRLNLNQIVSLMQAEDWADPAQFLHQVGVVLQQRGASDLDLDGQAEFWWIESTGDASDRFWILARQQDQPWLGRLTIPASAIEVSLRALEPIQGMPVFQLQRGEANVFFVYSHLAPDQAPTVKTLEAHKLQTLQQQFQVIRSGEKVQDILQSLSSLQSSSYFNCAQSTDLCQPSALLTYLVALSSELSGDTQAAADAYLNIWRNFPESSYAILSHARLMPEY